MYLHQRFKEEQAKSYCENDTFIKIADIVKCGHHNKEWLLF